MTLYWRNTTLNQLLGSVERPKDHPLDVYMAIEKLSVEEYAFGAKTHIPKFSVHNERSLQNFLSTINSKLGRRVYVSCDGLLNLGIVLSVETGYLVHISSTANIENNFIFGLASNVNSVLKNIVKSCDFKGEPPVDIALVKKWIKVLYLENKFELKINRYRPSFHIEYNTELALEKPILPLKHEVGIMNLYVEPNPLVPILNSYQCDFCLKSLAKIKHVMVHINENHQVPTGFKSNDFISFSHSQMTPKGHITVLVSEGFIKLEKIIISAHRKKVPAYFVPESVPKWKNQDLELSHNKLEYTINEISEFDEMFNFNCIVNFINNLKMNDINYYLDYCKVDERYRLIKNFLTKILFNIIVCQTRKYEFDTTLTSHRERTLKFYISSASRPSFVFGKISNPQRILNYAKAISEGLIILFGSLNLKRQKINLNCEIPDYKVHFSSSQKKLLKEIFKYVVANYKNKEVRMFDDEELKDTGLKLELEGDVLFFWNNLSKFFINISLQMEGRHTPLQTIFCLSTCNYEFCIKKLNFHRPPKRSRTFKALLYIIRLSFLSSINKKTDEYYNARITEATIKGGLRKIMEKLYYPTLYYFLKRKAAMLQPFFNAEKYTYVHPVSFKDKLVGCKILGLFSVNIMLNKSIEYIKAEIMYIRRFSEIQCDFDDDDSIRRVLEDYSEDTNNRRMWPLRKQKEHDPSYVENMLTKDFRRSISGITCLLIGYLVITNKPLSRFSEYLNIKTDALEFKNNLLSISTEEFNFTVDDESVVRYFKYYQVIRIFLLKVDEKIDDSFFFLKLDYVKPKTFFDLMGSRYTTYRYFCSFLKACHEKNNYRGERFSKNWIEIVRHGLRERSEGYLVINLKLIAPDHQKFVGSEDAPNVDPRSYLPIDEDFSLKDIIESGFLDYNFADEEDVEDDQDSDLTTANIAGTENKGNQDNFDDINDYDEEGDDDKSNKEDYETMINRIKMQLQSQTEKKSKH